MKENEVLNSVKSLNDILNYQFGTNPVFFDIVSVELKDGKEYTVFWFGPDNEFLNNYRKCIDKYFACEKNTSLLFLNVPESSNSTIEEFDLNIVSNETRKINFRASLTSKIYLSLKGKNILPEDKSIHILQWQDIVLKESKIKYATFVKIKFNLNNSEFASAIWIGYPDKLFKGKAHELLKTGYQLLLEKFLLEHSLNIIVAEKQTDLTNHATRAAISQVMVRCLSHNLGAHVMNKLNGNLRNVVNFFDNKNLKYESLPILDLDIYTQLKKELFEQNNNDIINSKLILEQLSVFNNYVKCRMDYLSDLSFGTPLMQTSKYVLKDIFAEFDKVRLLLENISGLSNFKFKIEFMHNGIPIDEDFMVAIPNDILGNQALYNIIENIIRNTAKHSNKGSKNGQIIFTLNFIDNNVNNEEILKNFYGIEIYDNVSISNEERNFNSVEKQLLEHYCKDTENDLGCKVSEIDWLVYNQNRKLNDSILQNNKLRSGSLGLIEMEASAAYLRKEEISLIEDNDKYEVNHDNLWINRNGNLNFLKAFKKECGAEFYLGYRLFVHRPAFVLIVTKQISKDANALKKEGVLIETPENFKTHLEAGKVYNHEFVLVCENESLNSTVGNDTDSVLEKYKTSLPVRIMKMSKMDLTELLLKTKLEELEKTCWERWGGKEYLNLQYKDEKNKDMPYKNGKFSMFLNHDDGYPDALESGKYFYLDALSTNSQKKLPKFNNDLSTYNICILRNNSVARIQIGESVISKILVIDERIQEYNKEKYLSISLESLYKNTGIIIPNKDKIDLSANTMDEKITNKIKDFINKQLNNNKKDIELFNKKSDFILMHYSILERMFNNENIRTEAISDYLKDLNNHINVVVTSGRGEPEGLPKEVRFINLSSVIYAFMEVKNKYLINYILHSSRKSNKSS